MALSAVPSALRRRRSEQERSSLVAQLARGRSLSDLLGAYSIVGESDYELGEVLRYFALPRRRARSLSRRRTGRGDDRARRTLPLARPAAAGAARDDARGDVLARARRLRVRVGVRAAHPGAKPLRRRSALPHPAARLGRARRATARGSSRSSPPRPLGRARPRSSPSSASSTPRRSRTRSCCCRGGPCRITSGSSGSRSSPSCSRSRSRPLFVLVPRRYALALPLVVLAYYAAVFHPIWAGEHGVKQASAGAVFQGIRGVPRDWIDAALPDGARAAVLWTGRADRFTVNQNEFFNRTVGPRLLPAPADAGRSRRDAGAHRPSRRARAPSERRRRSRSSTSSPTARSPRTARSSPATISSERRSGGSAAMSSRRPRSGVSTRTTPGRGRR